MRLTPSPVLLRALFISAAALVPASASAECALPANAAAALAQRSSAERLRYLSRALDRDAEASRIWQLAWGTAYGLGTIAQAVPIPILGPEDRKDFAVGAGSTAVGLVFTIVGTPVVMTDGPAFAARVAAGGDQCELVAEAERLVVKDAANELDGVAWYMHVVNVAFNAGVGLAIGLGFGHWVSALINFLVGAAIGEGTLFTQPTALDGAWARYRAGELGPAAPGAVKLELTPLAGSLGFALRF